MEGSVARLAELMQPSGLYSQNVVNSWVDRTQQMIHLVHLLVGPLQVWLPGTTKCLKVKPWHAPALAQLPSPAVLPLLKFVGP